MVYANFDTTFKKIHLFYDTYLREKVYITSNLIIGDNSGNKYANSQSVFYNSKQSILDPSLILHNEDCSKETGIYIYSSNQNALEIGIYSSNDISSNISFIKTNSNTDLIIGTSDTERIRITDDGYVGIFTSQPKFPFHVEDYSYFYKNDTDPTVIVENGTGPAMLLRSIGTNNNTPILHMFGGFSGATKLFDIRQTGNMFIMPTNTDKTLSIGTQRTPTTGTILDVNGTTIVSGNIGIGTTITQYKLHVDGNSYLRNTVSIGTKRSFTSDTIIDIVGNAVVSGNLGIGTTIVPNTLHVQGNIYTTNGITCGVTNRGIFSQISSNVNGGGSLIGNLYVNRNLNWVEYNSILGASLDVADGSIILPSGTYDIQATAEGFNCGYHNLKLINSFTNENIAFGSGHYSGSNVQTTASLRCIATLNTTANDRFKISHWVEKQSLFAGQGVYNGLYSGVPYHKYMSVHVTKLT